MNDLIKFINERSERERRLMLALFILLFLLILGGFANGIISSTTMASKRYQIAKSNYEYVKDSALMIINSSRSEISKKDLKTYNIKGDDFIDEYGFACPVGVRGRNSDNKLYEEKMGWKVSLPLVEGMEKTYAWINSKVNIPF